MDIHRQDGEIESRPKSIGGKIFDLLTYAGFAGVGTFFLTIPLANMFNKGGRLHKVDRGIADGVRKLGGSEAFGEKVAETTRFMWGGNVMLIPVTIMEHFRTNIVNGLNRLFKDPTDPESVKDAPPQTIGSILQGRVVAWFAVFAGFSAAGKIFPKTYQTFQNEFGERLCQLFKRPIKLPNGEFSKTYEFGKSAALDSFATATAATLLYIGSHFFAKRADEKKHHPVPQKKYVSARDEANDNLFAVNENAPLDAAPASTVSQVTRANERVASPEVTTVAI